MISAGKTTLIGEMSKYLKERGNKVGVIYELWEDKEDSLFREKTTRDRIMDNFLELYYSKVGDLQSDDVMKRSNAYAITLGHQVNFLSTRAGKMIEAISIGREGNYDYLILDRTHFEDLIFTAQNLHNNQTYWMSYQPVWKAWHNNIQHAIKGIPITNIILSVKNDTVMARIKKRNRPMEQGADLEEYFKNLNKTYVPEMVANMINKGWDMRIVQNDNLKIEEFNELMEEISNG